MQHRSSPTGRKRDGFSLVELVLALGILASAVVSVMGLLPVGLSSFNQAKTNTVGSQIVQTISNQIVLTEFSQLGAVASRQFSYDYEGRPVDPANEAAIYTAAVSFVSVANSGSYPVGLQTSTGNQLTDEALNVQIRISNKAAPGKTNVYALLVANNNN